MRLSSLFSSMLVINVVRGVTPEALLPDVSSNSTDLDSQNSGLGKGPLCSCDLGRGNFYRLLERDASQFAHEPVIMAQQDAIELPMCTNAQPAGHAARKFQENLLEKVLAAPGTMRASRTELGLTQDQLVMVDVGGEGQKTFEQGLKSGNVHAINLNAQTTLSSVPLYMQLEPDGPTCLIEKGMIPNLIRPAREWPDDGYQGQLFPLEDDFSNLTLMEGAPLFDYHIGELARITDENGWIVISVSKDFEANIQKLAERHNGGTIWNFPSHVFDRYILPPTEKADQSMLRDQFENASSHDLFDIVQSIRNQGQN